MSLSILAFSASEPMEDDAIQTPPETEQAPETPLPESESAGYFALPKDQRAALLSDQKKRISDLFSVPPGMKNMTGFWLDIYARYSTLQTVLYDREAPNIVYGVVDMADLFKKGASPLIMELTAKKRVDARLAQLRGAVDKLIANPNVSFKKGSAGSQVLALWGRSPKVGWRKIRENIRTQLGQRDRVIQGLSYAEPFIPAMEAIFKDNKLPVELTRLPLVESSFNLHAISKADAVGVWQFLERSAREFMKVDPVHQIDERRSPIKSTYAAAKMFKRNYKILGDYGLAIIAYNHGLKNLLQLKHRYRGNNISRLLRSADSPLGYASKNYYAEFLAMLIAEKYRDDLYGMPLERQNEHVSMVKLTRQLSIFDVASEYHLSLQELQLFNPDIFDLKRKLPRGTRIVLPRKVDDSFLNRSTAGAKERSPSSLDENIKPIDVFY